MKIDYSDKVVIVTGGANGMGAELVRILVDAGAKVAIGDINKSAAEKLARELGDAAKPFIFDIATPEGAADLIAATVAAFGRLDVVFNNAGKGHMADVEALQPEDWHNIIEINLSSAYYVCHAAMKHLRAAGGGSIVNVASVSGMFGDYAMLAYNAAKGGLINMTRAMALDSAKHNVRVNAVCPGVIGDTVMTAGLAKGPGGLHTWGSRIPLQRTGNAVEVARVMAFVGSDLASYMTGAVIPVDGGITCHTGFPMPGDFVAAAQRS